MMPSKAHDIGNGTTPGLLSGNSKHTPALTRLGYNPLSPALLCILRFVSFGCLVGELEIPLGLKGASSVFYFFRPTGTIL